MALEGGAKYLQMLVIFFNFLFFVSRIPLQLSHNFLLMNAFFREKTVSYKCSSIFTGITLFRYEPYLYLYKGLMLKTSAQ